MVLVALRLAFNRVVYADGLYRVVVGGHRVGAYDAAEVDRLRRTLLDPGVPAAERRALWRSWGPCSRHMWAAAVVECELDWQPRATARLCQELLSRALQVMTAPAWPRRLRQRALRDRGSCPVCVGANTGGNPAQAPEYAEQLAVKRLARWEFGTRFQFMAERGRTLWLSSTCPICAGGRGPICRPHLMEWPNGLSRHAVARLRETHARVRELTAAIERDGRGRTPATDAGLVEALGFIAGWIDTPLDVLPP
jgi:hypothetical protein